MLIDRVDEVHGVTRIIDYKTGAGKSVFSNIAELFDKNMKKRPKAVMQVFLYAWLYKRKHGTAQISPAIYYLRELFGDFDPIVTYNPGRNQKEKVEDFTPFQSEFETGLKYCLEEIFNPQTEFAQTTTEESCSYCTFKDICRKG